MAAESHLPTQFEKKFVIRMKRRITVGLKGLVLMIVLLNSGLIASAGKKEPKPLKLLGLARAVEPTRITILGKDGNELTLPTPEDFTEKVAVGSQVTAWYSTTDGGYTLKWLEYPLENFFRPGSEIRGQVKKIIILPSSDIPEADPVFESIAKYVESHLSWHVAPRALADEIRQRIGRTLTTLDVIDSQTGNFDVAAYVEASRTMAERVASEASVDAVLETAIERVSAPMADRIAQWDGAAQPIAGKWSRGLAMVAKQSVVGQVPAATVVLKLRDSHGKLLWSNRRGFAVLAVQKGMLGNFRERPLAEALKDSESVDRWLVTVFSSLVPENSSTKAALAR